METSVHFLDSAESPHSLLCQGLLVLLDCLDKAFEEQLFQLFLALVEIRLVSPSAEDSKDRRVLDLEFESKCLLRVNFGLFFRTVGESGIQVIRGVESQGQSAILGGVPARLWDLSGKPILEVCIIDPLAAHGLRLSLELPVAGRARARVSPGSLVRDSVNVAC